MRMFLRKSAVRRDPLVIAMSGVRMGERLLQVGIDDPAVLGALAAKVGISGHAAVVTIDDRTAARAQAAIADASTLADVSVTADGNLPFDDNSFDVVVVHSANGLLASLDQQVRLRLLQHVLRVTRRGGRVIVTEAGERSGVKALLAPAPKRDERYEAAGGTTAAMQTAGFKPVRLLADRDGYRFTEALKTADP
jgi:ubiquinone/menaquinone biosynthesis C-methylase UbiE